MLANSSCNRFEIVDDNGSVQLTEDKIRIAYNKLWHDTDPTEGC
jgi:hypothetical protein